ncbi:MAG TPA: IS481 family transposase [Miltoncostaea sp.]|jgi:transposase InsO family protein|nr:IS481 family transposase [Miltoncostaea sp.]
MSDKRRWLPAWQRNELVMLCLEHGRSRRQAAEHRHVSVSTVQYWVGRYLRATQAERASGAWAENRPSTPRHQPTRMSARVHDLVVRTRTRTGWGPRLIAVELGMAHATVWRCLRRRGVSRPPRHERDPVRRFEWPCPGDLLQMDTKRLARFSRPGHRVTGDRFRTGAEKRAGVGWEFCHSVIDDHTRLAYTEIHPDERAATVTGFLERALAFFAGLGIRAQRVQTDNAFTYVNNRSLREFLGARGITHRRIPPRTPKRNGKIERYQQTLAREWAHGQRYRDSDARAAALPHWLNHYNYTRNHSSLSNRPPISRLFGRS